MKRIIRAIGWVEILIGSITLLGSAASTILAIYNKPFAVTVFVTITSLVSLSLGMGLLKFTSWARRSIVFFSGYIILTKVLIFSGIIMLSGALETSIPSTMKNLISVIYHILIIAFFTRSVVKKEFK